VQHCGWQHFCCRCGFRFFPPSPFFFFGFGHFTHFAAQPELYKYCKLILNGWRGQGVTPPVRFFDVIACKFLHHLFTASENKSALVCLGFFLPSLFLCIYTYIYLFILLSISRRTWLGGGPYERPPDFGVSCISRGQQFPC